ncbi:MAG: response regulator [Spirochaetales bacterium]|nr:response regulator [Spirochaetales bacterium]
MREKIKRGLRSKILLVTIIPFVIIVILFNLVWVLVTDNIVKDIIVDNQISKARITSDRISDNLECLLNDVFAYSGLTDWFDESKKEENKAILEKISSNDEVFNQGYRIYDADGSLYLSGFENPLLLPNFEKEFTHEQLLAQQFHFSDIMYYGKTPYIVYFIALYEEDRLQGYFSGFLSLTTSKIELYFLKALEFSFTETGFSIIVDSNNLMVYHRHFKSIGLGAEKFLPELKSFDDEVFFTEDINGVPVICSISSIGFSDWRLILVEPLDVMYADIRTSTLILFSVLFLLFALMTVIIFLVFGHLISPLKKLKSAAQYISGGKFDIELDVKSDDEFQQLAEVFNDMAYELKNYYNHLEKAVLDRTSELELANKNLIIASEQAKQASRTKSLFLANMSHEIRTPMNAILGFSEILMARIEDEKLLEYVKTIYNSGENLLALINDILDISKVEAGKIELSYGLHSIVDIFDDIYRLFSQKFEEKSILLEIDVSPDFPDGLYIDRKRLLQILINLVNNAWKFTNSGSVKLSADVTGIRDGRGVLTIVVEDSGVGIAAEDLNDIFDPFHQIESESQIIYGGTGLGLSIVKGLLNLMGASISVTSSVGVGTRFEMKFPNIEVSFLHPKSKLEESEAAADLIFEKATIFVVDDIDYNRQLLSLYLNEYGFDLYEAKDGLIALALVEMIRPDLILLDMKMPNMNGFEVIDRLKKDENNKNIPIIAITASALVTEIEDILKVCDAVLNKPVTKQSLLNEMKKFLPWKEKK